MKTCAVCGEPVSSYYTYHFPCILASAFARTKNSDQLASRFHAESNERVVPSLVKVLSDAREQWMEDVRQYWGFKRDDDIDDALPQSIIELALTLKRQPDMVEIETWEHDELDGRRRMWSGYGRYEPQTAPRIVALLADECIARLPVLRERVLELAGHATYVMLSAHASNYLSSVAQLYAWGFDREIYPMARAVLEASLVDAIDAVGAMARAKHLLSTRSEADLGIRDLINVCGPSHLGLVSEAALQRAHAIRLDANDVLHHAASPTLKHSTALQLVEGLSAVLGELFPEPGAPQAAESS